jgi:transposase
LPVFAKPGFRQALSQVCATHARLGRASLVLYDVTTLHFETDAGDGFREPGFSKERRLDPQITLGLLTDATGFPLTVAAFEGNKAETATMVPVINAFQTAHQLSDVTVVADAGMPRGCRSSWARASRICPTWCANGKTSTPTR